MADDKRFRLKKQTIDAEIGDGLFSWIMFWRASTWGFRRLRPMLYRPVALFGTPLFIASYLYSPWLTACASLAITLVWPLAFPDSYLKHVAWRGPSFRRGLQIRWLARRKFIGAKVLSKEEPLPRMDYIRKEGASTVAHFVMPYGDTVPYWQEHADDLASAFGALTSVVNPWRRHKFTDLRPCGDFRFKLHPTRGWWKPPSIEFAFEPELLRRPPFVKVHHTEAKKRVPRGVEIRFLDQEPFVKPVNISFLDLHRPVDVYAGAGPTGIDINGLPYFENDRMSTLWVAVTGGGKTNTERCLVYADYDRVQARLVENWGCDLAYGVELSWMEKQFARVEYGEDPEEVNEFWYDLRVVMQERLRGMRGETTYFTPAPGDPILNGYWDEALLLNLPEFASVRAEVFKNQAAVLTNGRKAGVKIRTFTQTSLKDEYPLRDKYKIIKVGIQQRRSHVDMVAGTGAWESGIKAELLDPDVPGIFFETTEGARAANQMRYGDISPAVINKLRQCPAGMLGGRKEPSSEGLATQVREDLGELLIP